MTTPLQFFIAAYIECALWSSTDTVDDETVYLNDAKYGLEKLSDSTRQALEKQATDFFIRNKYLFLHHDALVNPPPAPADGMTDEEAQASAAGHDLWLTSHHHGSGFWDGDWKDEIGEELTNACQGLKVFDLYVGDDGMIYH